MLAKELFDLRSQLHQAGIIIAYCGYVTEPVLTGVGDALKQKLGLEDMDTKTARSVFAVFVEQMQNIIRYSAEKDAHAAGSRGAAPAPPELRYGILTIGRDGGGYIVKAGNLVEKGDIEATAQQARAHPPGRQGGAQGNVQGDAPVGTRGGKQGRQHRLHRDRT